MPEFMLYVKNQGEELSGPEHLEFVKKCEAYIESLKKDNRLIAAQPIDRTGKIVSHSGGKWSETPFNESKEIQVGYYHIRATNLDEAIAIAKKNPEFEYNTTARVEVRPLKAQEETTGYAYPVKN